MSLMKICGYSHFLWSLFNGNKYIPNSVWLYYFFNSCIISLVFPKRFLTCFKWLFRLLVQINCRLNCPCICQHIPSYLYIISIYMNIILLLKVMAFHERLRPIKSHNPLDTGLGIMWQIKKSFSVKLHDHLSKQLHEVMWQI